VAVPPERLWEILTRPEHIREWFMDSQVDLRPGGEMLLTSEESARPTPSSRRSIRRARSPTGGHGTRTSRG
jgi:uncharacterized protein YndB with AHSA1/START domain